MIEKTIQIIESYSAFDSVLITYLVVLILLLLIENGAVEKGKLLDFLHNLIVEAEHEVNGTKKGRERKKYVIEMVRKSLPPWMQIFITDALIDKMVQWAFNSAIKITTPDGHTIAVAPPQGTAPENKPKRRQRPKSKKSKQPPADKKDS
ncbi:MAG: hypothetical protein PHG02_10170 [Oscillospiraceae bacterium]|nr:hypothetical protein [Oscillospiraceae bacterium]